MDLQIDGKVALVLGGGGGLGGAIAMSLAKEGVKVAIGGRNIGPVEQVSNAINHAGGQSLALEWNLDNAEDIDKNFSVIESHFGRVEILVNNTGGPAPAPIAGQSSDLWRSSFESMVLSVISITDRVLPAMKDAQWGRIITSASSGVIAPIPNLGLSNALRISLVGWSKTLAREVGQYCITSNVIVPGRIGTKRIVYLDEKKAEREGKSVDEVAAESAALIPVGRYGTPVEYADTVAFLASKRASYITGSIIRVDGGMIQSI